MRYHERMVMLSVLDGLWKDHLLAMDHLKEGIGLRGYAQQDPLVAYKKESFEMFEAMMLRFQEDTARYLFRMQIVGPDGQPMTEAPALNREVPAPPPVESALQAPPREAPVAPISVPTRAPSTTIDALEKEFERKKQRELGAARLAGASGSSEPTPRNAGSKVGRNDPCPCGSGKKFKKCHGVEA
jgi:preprotein translocase subunit SecA